MTQERLILKKMQADMLDHIDELTKAEQKALLAALEERVDDLCSYAEALIAQREKAPSTSDLFEKLVRLMWYLRQPGGCSWDRAQTHESICENLLEEAYESAEAIQQNDAQNLCEELGDLLEQVLLQSQIAADAGEFTIEDVNRALYRKIVRRHPHLFGSMLDLSFVSDGAMTEDEFSQPDKTEVQEPQEVQDLWQLVKDQERKIAYLEKQIHAAKDQHKSQPKGLLDSIPQSLPPLQQCEKISQRTAALGFDWKDTASVWQQVQSEYQEFCAEELGSEARLVEFGDLLFALVNAARKEGIDASQALARSNAKFRRRWSEMEKHCWQEDRDISSCDTAELNRLWDAAKSDE